MTERPFATHYGFTLIEILIVATVVAILAAIALPNYREHVRRAQRLDARANLMDARHWMEQQFTINSSYDGVTLPAAYAQSPKSGQKYYDIVLSETPAVTPTSYTLLAIPVATMPDKCGTLSIDQSNQRGLLGQSAGMSIGECWGR